jgi:hypothetical protein
MNRTSGKQRRPIQASDLDALEQINLDAAGIDIGANEIYVAVPKGRDVESVRVFATFTVDLERLADWLHVVDPILIPSF